MNDKVSSCNVLVASDNSDIVRDLNAILYPDYEVRTAASGTQALSLFAQSQWADIVLLDVELPDMDGPDVCRLLKQSPATADIPVIFISTKEGGEHEYQGFELGATDYIAKPFSAPLVRARVRIHASQYRERAEMRRRVATHTEELNRVRYDIVRGLCKAAELKDYDTGFHVIRIGHYARLIAETLDVSREWSKLLQHAAPMHDIGKIVVPDQILRKAGKLDPMEWAIMKQHCRYGAEILGEHSLEPLQMAATIAYTHHERWDGSGYPRALKGREIPLEGRIVAVADVFDALIDERSYKRAWTVGDAAAYISLGAGSHFDPEIVPRFLDVLPQILAIKAQYSVDPFDSRQLGERLIDI